MLAIYPVQCSFRCVRHFLRPSPLPFHPVAGAKPLTRWTAITRLVRRSDLHYRECPRPSLANSLGNAVFTTVRCQPGCKSWWPLPGLNRRQSGYEPPALTPELKGQNCKFARRRLFPAVAFTLASSPAVQMGLWWRPFHAAVTPLPSSPRSDCYPCAT